MKISIITVVRNAETTIADAIESVAAQTHSDVEHIVIDGLSTDRTPEIIKQYSGHLARVICEADQGIYHAMNKGLQIASGEVIGILNADDVYEDDTVLAQVARAHEDQQVDACYADLVYVKADDLSHVVRNWRSRDYLPGLSFRGWMPAHPTLFIKSKTYQMVGLFNVDLQYQADLEFCARLFEVHKINSVYIPRLWVRMRLGGVTNNSFKTILKGNWESYQALKKLGLDRNPVSYFTIKFASRLRQYF
ncbi:MAG: glycosyltransferase [Gammaproteobacteria bacterium]|nr:glycosyltransferase [Gammaproteobacteria bacterium]